MKNTIKTFLTLPTNKKITIKIIYNETTIFGDVIQSVGRDFPPSQYQEQQITNYLTKFEHLDNKIYDIDIDLKTNTITGFTEEAYKLYKGHELNDR